MTMLTSPESSAAEYPTPIRRPRPSLQAWSWFGTAQDGDLVAQHEELDVLGGGPAAQQ
jgi:hypothetical protein